MEKRMDVEKIVTTKELCFPHSGKASILFPVGSEGFLMNLADLVLVHSIRDEPLDEVEQLIDACMKLKKVPAVVEGQMIPLYQDEYELKKKVS